MINLETDEKIWILICKGGLRDKYPYKGSYIETMKPYFVEIYGWNPDEDNNYADYLTGLFNKLFDTYQKIKCDGRGNDIDIKSIFEASFCKHWCNNEELPIERAIREVCSLIRNTLYLDKDGNKRYELC